MKTHKRTKSSRQNGRKMGTHGSGARKKNQGSGHRGGKGMSGSGKRADHKKTLVNKLYGHKYFGKQGITSRGTKRDKLNRINVGEIQDKYAPGEIKLLKYKILGKGEITGKYIITCFQASKSAIEKVKKAGGEIIVKEIKKIETPLVVNPKHAKKDKGSK